MADISEIRLQNTEAKRMPTSVEGCQKTPTKTPHWETQKENDCKAKPTLQGRKKEECFSEERNDGLPIVTTAEEQQKLLQAPLSRTKDALRRSEFVPRSAARVSSSPETSALQSFPKPNPEPNEETSPRCIPNLVQT
jgi:hypothetical protein